MPLMSHGERVLTVFSGRIADKVPKWIPPGTYLNKLVKENTGCANPAEYFDMDIDQLVYYQPTRTHEDFSEYYPDNHSIDVSQWGTKKGQSLVRGSAPMKDFSKVDDIHKYPFPDVGAPYRYENLSEDVRRVKEKGLPAVSGYEPGTFEQAYVLRGMENLLFDLLEEPEFLTPLLEKISDLKARIAVGYAQAGVDILWIGDDLGTEHSMLMSPEVWRKHLKSCLKKIIQNAKKIKCDILVAYHSDGYYEPVIPDLIEVGVDILQAVQPESMDPAKLKKKYGDKLSFWGTVSAQNTMPLGTSEDVKREVKRRIETVGKGGGLCIGPSHTLEPPTPWKNIVAFFEAVETFGDY